MKCVGGVGGEGRCCLGGFQSLCVHVRLTHRHGGWIGDAENKQQKDRLREAVNWQERRTRRVEGGSEGWWGPRASADSSSKTFPAKAGG